MVQHRDPEAIFSFNVNGRPVTVRSTAQPNLLLFLRRNLNLTGPKLGCGQGRCGACTVLLDGEPVKSCTLPLKPARLAGKRVVTIEGLAPADGTLHPLQEAFVRCGALQCGFCSPGMILSLAGLLNIEPRPDRKRVREWLAQTGNLCRCTGYQKIFQAVDEAVRLKDGQPGLMAGAPDDASLRRTEAREKVTGRLRYAADIRPDDALYGGVLFAPAAPARLKSLEVQAALAVPGVEGVITAADIPGSNRLGLVERDQPALVDIGEIARSVADPVAGVFAANRRAVEAGVKALATEWETLPGVYDPDAAMAPDAPLVHGDKPGNVFHHHRHTRGDVEAVFDGCAVIVDGEFTTSRVIHGYMEPEAGLARPDGRGGVEILYPTQTVFDDRVQLAEVLDLPPDLVRVIQTPIGGAFGGKEDIIFHHLLALAALKFNRPVKITLSRRQSLAVAQKKHPVIIRARLGLDEEGRMKALRAEIIADKGAYASLGHDIMDNLVSFIGGIYHIPAVEVEGRSYHTHNTMSGAMRGFGANQACFAIESLVDMAAARLGMDPLAVRRINALAPGGATTFGQEMEPGLCGAREVLDELARAVAAQQPPVPEPGWRLGFGMAAGVKNVGFGNSLPESAGAVVELFADGRVHLTVSHHEMGQGADVGQARLAAEALDLPVGSIEVFGPDTARSPYTGATSASRQTCLSGNATLAACRQLKSDILTAAAARMGLAEPGTLVLQGAVIRDTATGRVLPLADMGRSFRNSFTAFAPATDPLPQGDLETPVQGGRGPVRRRLHWAYSFGAQAAWVTVDPESGRVRVLKVVAVNDVGRVLNRRAVESQQEGGVMMGLGYGLSERFELADGKPVSQGLGRCGLPGAGEAPEIICRTVETPHPWGPYGIKGLAEAPSLPTAPAIANAIASAMADLGSARCFDLPMTPDRVRAAIGREPEED